MCIRDSLYVFSGRTWLAAITPYPQPLGPLQGAGGVGRGMAWFAGAGGFPCTLSRCPMGGRRGADDAAGGLFAAAPQGGYGLVCALPLAGGTKKMACWGAASVGSKRTRSAARGRGGVAALRRGRGVLYVIFEPYLARIDHPLPPAPRPPLGGQGSGTRNGLIRGQGRFSVHTVAAADGWATRR